MGIRDALICLERHMTMIDKRESHNNLLRIPSSAIRHSRHLFYIAIKYRASL